MPDAFTPDHVRKLARLAKLELSDDEVARYQHDLAAVLGYFERLRSLDLTGVEPLAGAGASTGANRLAPDEIGPTLPTEAFLRLAPATDGPFVKVPKVVGGESGA